jgi:hypothetical protein
MARILEIHKLKSESVRILWAGDEETNCSGSQSPPCSQGKRGLKGKRRLISPDSENPLAILTVFSRTVAHAPQCWELGNPNI